MNKIKIYFSALCFAVSVYGIDAQVQIKLPYPKFEVLSAPSDLTDEVDRNVWTVTHYWDKFNFANAENIKNPELAIPVISNYIGLLDKVPADIAQSCITDLLKKSKANDEVYKYIANTLSDLLGNTVSPYRNDEYLIIVLEDLLSSDDLSDEDSSRYVMNLSMAKKNRVGTIAADIVYVNTENRTDSLYNIQADFTLLMFYSPGCHACEAAEKQIRNSEVIGNWLESGDLKLLAFAPEAPVDEWKASQDKLPSEWINGYDPAKKVWFERIYDIQGFPTIYLLDKDKRVILKDSNIGTVENYLMEQAMSLPPLTDY
ncbi:DUF5106 domain-containing protein [Dysgonomonas capnocytophagoides]|uniref:DUF5106 domain-containing protein n=1 Tax=Dysgonomonas capnocytophagoides TaxID=45254 RepID=UPI003341ABF3